LGTDFVSFFTSSFLVLVAAFFSFGADLESFLVVLVSLAGVFEGFAFLPNNLLSFFSSFLESLDFLALESDFLGFLSSSFCFLD